MSWLSEGNRIYAAVYGGGTAAFTSEADARAWLEQNAPTWQAQGHVLNLAGNGGATTGTPAREIVQASILPALGGAVALPALAGGTVAAIMPWLAKIPALAALLGLGGAAVAGVGALTGAGGGRPTIPGERGIQIGVPEPHPSLVRKAWKTKAVRPGGIIGEVTGQNEWWIYFWALHDGRIVMYNPDANEVKTWRPKKNVVISSNPRLSTVKKLDRIHRRVGKLIKRYAPRSMAPQVMTKRGVCK